MKRNKLETNALAIILGITPAKGSYQPIYPINAPENQIQQIENSVQPTSRSNLPSGADGVFYMHNSKGEYDKDLPEPYKTFVRQHEIRHGFGEHDEYKADVMAAAETGHLEYVRGPFYRPPLR